MGSPAEPPEPPDEDLSGTLAELTADDLDQTERRRLLGRLAGQIRARGIGDLFRPRSAIRWIADLVGDIAPRLPIRSREMLQQHFPGLSDKELADRLVRNAGRTTAAVGAASGGAAAIDWVATPTLLSAPVAAGAPAAVAAPGASAPGASAAAAARSARTSRSGCRALKTQYGVGSAGSSRTTRTASRIQGRCTTKASGSACAPSAARFSAAS